MNLTVIVFVAVVACDTTGGIAAVAECSKASLAPKGTVLVTYKTAAVGSAVITILAQAPNTKVAVKCPTIPDMITVTTVRLVFLYISRYCGFVASFIIKKTVS